MEEIKVSEMLQADSINKDDSVMIIQNGVNKKASGSIQTATGTSLSLTSVADICKVKSNSKNLFNNQISTQTKGGVTITKGKDGTLTLNGTTTNNVLITIDIVKLENGKTYTLSGGSEVETQGARIDMRVSADGGLYNTWYIPDNPTRTMTEDVTLYAVLRLQNGVTFDNVVIKPQLEEGSTATTYNPYDTEITICGKNLFDQSKIINPPADGSQYPIILTLKPNTQYTMSSNCPDSSGFALIFFVSGTDYSSVTSSNNGIWEGQTKTFTSDSNGNMVVVYRRNSGDTNINLGDYWYQIEEGSTATTYEKFEGQYLDLIPDETKSAFTYDSLTNILSNGSVTIEYNTQSRLLNNNDVLDIVDPVKEYVDREINTIAEDVYIASSTSTGTTSLQFPDISKYKYIDIFYSNTTGAMGNVVRLEPRIAIGKDFVIASNSTASTGATIYLNMNKYTLTATSITFIRRTEKSIDGNNTIASSTSTSETNISINRIIGYK